MVISMFWLQAGRLLRWPAPEEMDHTQAIGKSAVFEFKHLCHRIDLMQKMAPTEETNSRSKGVFYAKKI